MVLIRFLVLAIVASLVQSAAVNPSLRFGAFNVRTFGKSKMSKAHIADILAKIVVRYDVMLLQEIRDISGWAVDELLKLTKAINPNYDYVISDRLGRSSYKEQYAFFYRTDRINVKSTYQYDDGPDDGTDIFEREPYCVELEPFATGKYFGMCGIHIKPAEVVGELTGLVDVYNTLLGAPFSSKNFILMGDFNADCSYLSASKLGENPLYTDSKYHWLISSNEDTTTSSTDCAYDRIVISGDLLENALISDSAIVYRFDVEYNLDSTEAYDVSDHYPVEARFQF